LLVRDRGAKGVRSVIELPFKSRTIKCVACSKPFRLVMGPDKVTPSACKTVKLELAILAAV